MSTGTTRGPLKDAYGRRVPERLVGPFSGGRMVRDWIKQLRHIDLELRRMASDPANNVLAGSHVCYIHQRLEEVSRYIERFLPAIPCFCGPNDLCSLCDHKRWLSTYDIYRLSGERKKAMLAAAFLAPSQTTQPLLTKEVETTEESVELPSALPEIPNPSLPLEPEKSQCNCPDTDTESLQVLKETSECMVSRPTDQESKTT